MNNRPPHEREFEVRFLKSRGTAFQDLFVSLAERVFPKFEPVRAHGRIGDLKCDGYLRSERTVFQVYGPDDMSKAKKLVRKIDEDFNGALTSWPGMRRWVFVHNSHQGLPAPAIQHLEALRATTPEVAIDVWGFAELLGIVRQLKPEDLQSLFPVPELSDSATPSRLSAPRRESIEAYWRWLAANARNQLNQSAVGLKGFNVPLRLIRYEDNEALRADEEASSAQHFDDNWVSDWKYISLSNRYRPPETYDFNKLQWLLRMHQRLLVVGDSGSGKSTYLRHVALTQAERLITHGFRRHASRTPVLVELWRLGNERPILDVLVMSVTQSNSDVTRDAVVAMLERGYLLVLLDGLDEVPANQRTEFLAQVLALTEKYPRCHYILTSRPFPIPPKGFHQFTIAPLRDEDIAVAVDAVERAAGNDSDHEFRSKLSGMSLSAYVRSGLRPAMRQLCRRPLTLALVVSVLLRGNELPATLFLAYERFVTWLLGWEDERGRLPSAVGATEALQESAYELTGRGTVAMPSADWAKASGRAIEELRARGVATNIVAEEIIRSMLSTGIIRRVEGDISFAHKSFQEYFTARRIVQAGAPVQSEPAALHMGVARFLCSALKDATPLLDTHFKRCSDVEFILPLLQEAERAETLGEFSDLNRTVVDGFELGERITHSLHRGDAEFFSDEVEGLVQECVNFGPKMVSVLKNAAYGVAMGAQFRQSRKWFEFIVDGFEELGWAGSEFHRNFLHLGFFEAMHEDRGVTDYSACTNHLYEYLRTVHAEDWSAASGHLTALSQLILPPPDGK